MLAARDIDMKENETIRVRLWHLFKALAMRHASAMVYAAV